MLSTYDHGAITIDIESDGRLVVVTRGPRQLAVQHSPPVEDGEGTEILPQNLRNEHYNRLYVGERTTRRRRNRTLRR